MKVNQLKNIIKEAVREAVREELKDLLNEAVSNASTPTTKPTPQPVAKKAEKSGDPIMEMLNMTQQSMTREDFRNVVGSNVQPGMESMNFSTNSIPTTAPSGPHPGLDISRLSFVKNAAAVYNKSVEKDRFKVGG